MHFLSNLSEAVAILREASKPFTEETYWTAFGLEGHPDPDKLHCTHKFLGNQDPENVAKISKVIDDYYNDVGGFDNFRVAFDQEQWFGEDKDTRVLMPSKVDLKLFHPKLKTMLDQFKEDTYPDYKPHVTTDMDKVDVPFDRYVLMQGKKKLKEWASHGVAVKSSGKIAANEGRVSKRKSISELAHFTFKQLMNLHQPFDAFGTITVASNAYDGRATIVNALSFQTKNGQIIMEVEPVNPHSAKLWGMLTTRMADSEDFSVAWTWDTKVGPALRGKGEVVDKLNKSYLHMDIASADRTDVEGALRFYTGFGE